MADHEAEPAYAELVSFIPQTPAEASKAIAMLVATVAAGIVAAQENGVSLIEWLQIAVVLVAAIPVYLFAGVVAKTIAAFLAAALTAGIPIVGNAGDIAAVSGASWLVVLLAGAAAIGVGVIPNAPWSGKQGENVAS